MKNGIVFVRWGELGIIFVQANEQRTDRTSTLYLPRYIHTVHIGFLHLMGNLTTDLGFTKYRLI